MRKQLYTFVFILTLNVNSVEAQESQAIDIEALAIAHAALLKEDLLNHFSKNNKQTLYDKLSETEIVFSKDMEAGNVAYAANDNKRYISISLPFLRLLGAFIEKHITSPFNDQQSVRDFQRQMFLNAITDIILHEFGHHALEMFYNEFTSIRFLPRMEQEAQNWAVTMKVTLEQDEEDVGRLITLIALIENELAVSELSNSESTMLKTLKDRIGFACFKSNSDTADKICTELIETVYSLYALRE
ncbi:MAG: hypothetical protein AAGJ37_06850 [Pseudomonadota bacterium]